MHLVFFPTLLSCSTASSSKLPNGWPCLKLCFPLHFFPALLLPMCFTTEQSTVEASLFVKHYTLTIAISFLQLNFKSKMCRIQII